MDQLQGSHYSVEPGPINPVRTRISELIKPEEHHKQYELCMTRAKYRQGKEYKAVKVYTINEESCHLLLQNIPAVGLGSELKKLCKSCGQVDAFELVPHYPPFEEFTETFYVKYATLKQAKFAKKKLDNRSFYGSLIHICYAPELETVEECGEKLMQRREYVHRYVDPYTILSKKEKAQDSQSGCFNRKSETNLLFSESATRANVSDQLQQPEIISTIRDTQPQEKRILAPPCMKGAASTWRSKRSEAESKQMLLSSSSVIGEKKEKPKHLQAYMWKLQKGKNIREQSSCTSSSYVCESEKVEIAPQQWARTGQKTTFDNPQLIQSSISTTTTKTAKEFGKDLRIQEAFPNSTAGTSYSSISSTGNTTMHSPSRTDTLPLTTSTSTSFFDRTSKERVLFKQTQTYNVIKPKPLSETRIVFHLKKKKIEEDTTEDDSTTNKRKKEDDRDGNLKEIQDKK